MLERTAEKPEIMSPAGYWPQLQAAVEAGADAVYFGLKHFTARAKAGFSLTELPEALRALHQRGVKGYVTFNSLVFDHELSEAARVLAAIAGGGADAIIVQDAGIAKLAKRIAPELDLHASTQMSVTNADGVRLAQRFGCRRVTLARELSLDEVRAIRAATDCELEIFVHGALCVAYSGQCFSSEAWGGRSANRGQCAQACRLPYDLLVDGKLTPLGDARYLLSPGDLYALHQIPEIVRIGIAALKIEGRYKDADYVALATRAYRKAVDEAWSGRQPSTSPLEELQLQQVYSRDFGPHFLTGTNHQAVVEGRAPRHRGVQMGRVSRLTMESAIIEPAAANALAPLKPGDGVVFDAADWRSPEEREEGARIYEVAPGRDGTLELRFGNGEVDFARIRPGDRLWRTHDPDIDRVARPFIHPSSPVARQPVEIHARADEGAPLVAEWILANHPAIRVTVQSEVPLEAAGKQPLSLELLRDQFGRLGNTPYELAEVKLEAHGRPFAPASLLNRLRQQAVEGLRQMQARPRETAIQDPASALSSALASVAGEFAHRENIPPQLHLLVRTPEQLEAALALFPASITLDYLDLYGLRPSVDRVRAAGIAVRAASPRIVKPGEERIEEFLLNLACPILVRSTGLVDSLRTRASELIGDFSLNVANVLTAAEFFRFGLKRITPTHDLNADQVAALADTIGPESIEAIAYQHLPVFHTEHCVFCRFLSTGTSYRDCGRPCEKHRIEIRDVSGRAHPVLADVGCRNTVFGAEAQEASAHLAGWLRTGIRHFRLEFAHESPEQVTRVTEAFRAAFDGRKSMVQLGQELRRAAPQGITEGSLFVPAGYLTLPVLQ